MPASAACTSDDAYLAHRSYHIGLYRIARYQLSRHNGIIDKRIPRYCRRVRVYWYKEVFSCCLSSWLRGKYPCSVQVVRRCAMRTRSSVVIAGNRLCHSEREEQLSLNLL